MTGITRKTFIAGATSLFAAKWRALAAPARRQRNYDDMTWWDPYVENITDVDTYLRRKFAAFVGSVLSCVLAQDMPELSFKGSAEVRSA